MRTSDKYICLSPAKAPSVSCIFGSSRGHCKRYSRAPQFLQPSEQKGWSCAVSPAGCRTAGCQHPGWEGWYSVPAPAVRKYPLKRKVIFTPSVICCQAFKGVQRVFWSLSRSCLRLVWSWKGKRVVTSIEISSGSSSWSLFYSWSWPLWSGFLLGKYFLYYIFLTSIVKTINQYTNRFSKMKLLSKKSSMHKFLGEIV